MKKQALTLATALLLAATTVAQTTPIANAKLLADFKQQQITSIAFTENKGQVHDQNYKPRPDVLYGVMTGNMAVHIKNNGVSYQLNKVDTYKEVFDERTRVSRQEIDQQTIYRIDLTWLNHNPNFTQTQDETLPGCSNYYLENCPNGALHVKSYTGVTLHNLYKGINLHYYEKNNELKHDYIVAAHADYKQIQIRIKGADISINKDGSLILTTPLGKVQEGAPLVYQNGKQLKAKWIITNTEQPALSSSKGSVSFDIENYNPGYELIIDPVTRIWGTYYGSTGGDEGYSCTTDASGNVYMAGVTTSTVSTIVATIGSHQSVFGGPYDAFLVKFNASGVRQWATYYGGAGDDRAYSCATDASGNVYLAGYTNSNTSTVIATSGGHQPAYGGGTYDAFLVKFDSGGIRQWGTYYGDSGDDRANSCTTDASGNVYLVGLTTSNTSTVISTLGCHQSVYGGGGDAFLVKFNSSGTRQWGTYYGGIIGDNGNSCSTDASGNVYMTGYSDSNTGTVISTFGSHQSAFGGGSNSDAFLVKFDSGGIRQWGTYYGGTGTDGGQFCSTDASNNIYLSGYTNTNTGTIIATSGSHQSTFGGGGNNYDAFLVKFNSSGIRQWGTYYGGTAFEYGNSCVTDIIGNVCMVGSASSSVGTIIATSGSHQSTIGGGTDGYAVKFDAGGIRQWGTYYGGTAYDNAYSCTSDVIGNVYLAGLTLSSSGTVIATSGSQQDTFGGGGNISDAFLVKFDACDVAPAQPSAITGSSVVCAGVITSYSTPLAFGANSYTWSLPVGWLGAGNSNVISTTPASSGVFTLIAGNACGVSPQQTFSITVNLLPTLTVNSGSICAGQSFTLLASGANTYSYSGGAVVSPTTTSSYTVTGTSSLACSNTVVSSVLVNPLPTVSVNNGAICLGQSFTIIASGASTYNYSSGPIVSPSLTSSYSVSGTSAAGCASSNTAISAITVSSIHPTITVNSGTICLGKSFTIIPSGASTYTIQGGNFIVSPVATVNYTVAGTSTAGCISSNTAVANISVNPLPVITVSSSNSFICEGESALLTASGASSYTFNPGGIGASITVSPNITTTYMVTGTDTSGCRTTASMTQSVDACVGIATKSPVTLSEVEMFPNPTTGIINLELNSNQEVIILNALGQIVYTSKLSSGTHQINLDYLAKGIYIVRLSNSSKSSKVIKE